MGLTVARAPWASLSTGEGVDLYTLKNGNGVTATVSTFGAALVSLFLPDRNSDLHDVVLGFGDGGSYEGDGHYFGASVGRFAGRIRGGRYELDGTRHELSTNAGRHHLHGGTRGFHQKLWRAGAREEEARVGVALSLSSEHGEEGHPGDLEVSVTYWLDAHDRLTLEYEARADLATHVNLTHHSYFNLAGGGTVSHHRLRIPASRYLPVDEDLIPLGMLADVAGTPFDFTAAKRVMQDVGPGAHQVPGYDHTFALDGWDGSLRECARLEEPGSGRIMTVATTCPGVHLFVADFPPPMGMRNAGAYEPPLGLCLETQFFPDAPNHPHFPSTRVEPGEVWRHATEFSFSVGC